MDRHGTPLNMACSLALISETLRFWTDEVRGVDGKMYPPRCFDAKQNARMRESLIRLDGRCKTAIQGFREKPKLSYDPKLPHSIWYDNMWAATTNVETFPPEFRKQFAAELVRRWNAHDEMRTALEALLEDHCCDTGEANYKAEWDGDHTVCDVCKPTYKALRHARGEK